MIHEELSWIFTRFDAHIPFAFSRFNDGEMGGISKEGFVAARGDQVVTRELRESLIDAIQHKQTNYFVGVPCSQCFPEYHELAMRKVPDQSNVKCAVVMTNRNWKNFVDNIGTAMKGKKVYWVSGDDQDVSKLPFEVYDTKFIPNRDSWAHKAMLHGYEEEIESGAVVFISCGPLARVLVKEWFQKRPDVTFIDIGSTFDPYTRNVRHRCHTGWENGFNDVPRCVQCN
tara:strand:- start:22 stop:705 length:684 start_codon:yes stop_codon:yes gene_type:complete